MLTDPTLEELLERTENRYTLAILVARRARQLVDGGQPLVDQESVGSNNIVSVAAEEVAQDKVASIPNVDEYFVPLRRDVRERLLEAERQAEAEMLGEESPSNAIRPALTDQEIEDIKDRGRANVIQRLDPEEADFEVPDSVMDHVGTEPQSPLAFDLLAAVERLGGYEAVEDDGVDLDDLDLDNLDSQPSEDDDEFLDFDDDDDLADLSLDEVDDDDLDDDDFE